MFVIPVFGKLRLENHKFKTSLDYIVRLSLVSKTRYVFYSEGNLSRKSLNSLVQRLGT